ncbi:short-chain dehydrogenase [Shewanella sp. OPT22]|nr:short-chain dehydrogenase [Shewanella sp. OPT22]
MSYIIVTGATGGLAQAIINLLLQGDDHLVLFGRDITKLQQLKLRCSDTASIEKVNLDCYSECENIFSRQLLERGTPKLVINCAGSGLFGQLDKLDSKKIESTLSNNLLSVINPCKVLFEPMKKAGGTIINVMSTAALKGKAGESIYCAAKWGVRGFTESLREEAKGSKLRVVAVYPAGMNTGFWDDSAADYPTETFMSAEDAAAMIVNVLPQAEKGYISEITLSR